MGTWTSWRASRPTPPAGDPLAAAALVRATQSDVWRLCAALGDPAVGRRPRAGDLPAGLRLAAPLRGPVVGAHLAAGDRPPGLRRRRPHPAPPPADRWSATTPTWPLCPRRRRGPGRRVRRRGRPAGPAGPRPPRGVRAHPAPGPALRRGRRGRRLPRRHHPLPGGACPGRPRRVPRRGGRRTTTERAAHA